MHLITLWTWTYEPELNKFTSCYLLKVKNKNIVFDFGRWAINQLLRVGIEYYQIDSIFITHTHADHCCDLAPFLHIALCELPNRSFRKKDLTIYWPVWLKDSVNYILKAFALDIRKPKHKIIIREMKDKQMININGINVKCFDVNHKGNCLSYRVEYNKKILSMSGDSWVCPWLLESIKNSDIAVLESTVWNDKETLVHLNPKIAVKIAKENNVKKVILTHIWLDAYEDAENIKDNNFIIAKDLMSLNYKK